MCVCVTSGARGEADAQNITVLAMWMIEHPGTEDEHDEPHGRGGGGGSDSSCAGAAASAGGKSLDRSSYLCSPGDIASADASEMEEGFSERYFQLQMEMCSYKTAQKRQIN